MDLIKHNHFHPDWYIIERSSDQLWGGGGCYRTAYIPICVAHEQNKSFKSVSAKTIWSALYKMVRRWSPDFPSFLNVLYTPVDLPEGYASATLINCFIFSLYGFCLLEERAVNLSRGLLYPIKLVLRIDDQGTGGSLITEIYRAS